MELIFIPNLYKRKSSLYVLKELRLSGTYFHDPDEFLIRILYTVSLFCQDIEKQNLPPISPIFLVVTTYPKHTFFILRHTI